MRSQQIAFSVIAVAAFACRTTPESTATSRPVEYWKPPSQEATATPPPSAAATSGPQAPAEATTAAAPVAGNVDAIVADHRAAAAFATIPRCWLARGARVRVAYEHTSHGSQLVSGLNYLAAQLGAPYALGEPNGLALRDSAMAGYADNASDLGYDGWSAATAAYLAKNPATDAVMWSWCGQVGGHVSDMPRYLFAPAERVVGKSRVRFVYMTGHLDGGGPSGDVWRANELIRQHVRDTNGILFDFADIESYDPDGNAYPSGSDACEWCSSWCARHGAECQNLPECAHSHGFNCVQKGKAYWWLVARMAGWNGRPGQPCPAAVR
jgi:hypothetical protein